MNLTTTHTPRRWSLAASILLVWPLLGAAHATAEQLLGYAQETRTVIS